MQDIKLSESETLLLADAANLIERGLAEKSNPSKLRLILVELQALRFDIGRALGVYKAKARVETRAQYWDCKNKKMSPNASYKEAEMNDKVVEYKNARDFMQIAYDTISDFVTTNQSSLKIAAEEAKNNL
jgi:hypothetical protein